MEKKEMKERMATAAEEIRNDRSAYGEFLETGSWENSADKTRWVSAAPKAYSVQAVMLPEGTPVPNKLEHTVTPAKAGLVTLIGTVGEMWQVSAEKLASKYCLPDGSRITEAWLGELVDGEPRTIRTVIDGSAPSVRAFKTDENDRGIFVVNWGASVIVNGRGVGHAGGDWLVADGLEAAGIPGECWTVNGEVFANTYAVEGRPGDETTPQGD